MTRPAPIPSDSHRFVKRLTDEGMPAGQAEALADEQISLLRTLVGIIFPFNAAAPAIGKGIGDP